MALKSATQNHSDPSIKQGVKWLLNSIGGQYDNIAERVRTDVMELREIEAQQRRERAERVKRIREERERYIYQLLPKFHLLRFSLADGRQRILRGEAGDEDEVVDGGTPANPFKPITVTCHLCPCDLCFTFLTDCRKQP